MTETNALPAPAQAAALRKERPAAALGVAMLGFFAVALDSQVVNVALPSIRRDLGGGLVCSGSSPATP